VLAGAAGVVGAVLSGCGGPVQAGSAAIVGDTSVPLSLVQDQIAAAQASIPAGQRTPDQDVAYARSVVADDVVRGLLARRSASAGVTIDDKAVDDFIQQQGGLTLIEQQTGLTEAEIRSQARNLVTSIELGRRVAPGLSVTADVVPATSRADAEAKAHALAAGGPAAAALLADPAAQRGKEFRATDFQLSPGTAGASQRTVIFGTSVGETVAYQPDPQQGAWSVFRVTQRRTDGPADPGAADKLDQSTLLLLGQRQIQPLADELGMRINPRYGVWDPIALTVVSAGQTAGVILPAG
jgi:hypothetical protein